MNNELIADVFDRVADLLEFQGANAFRVRAYRSGARTIRELLEPVATIVTTDAGQLTKIAGIGKDLAAKCVTLVETGTLPMLEKLLAEIPSSVLDLLRIPGLGPKKAAVLYRELNITTLDEVQLACEQGRVRELKGFAAKTEQTILAGIEIAASANQRTYWSKASVIAEDLKDHLASCPSIEKLELAGSFRRGKETVGDLDFLAVSTNADEVMDRLAEYSEVKQVIGRGPTKMSIRLEQGLQVDLRIVPAESFGAALQYFTGSKEHNVVLRGLARRRGMKINEYGVYRVDGDEETYLAGRSEAEVYAAVDLPVFAPELRENRREFVWAEQHSLPELIELGDLRGDLGLAHRGGEPLRVVLLRLDPRRLPTRDGAQVACTRCLLRPVGRHGRRGSRDVRCAIGVLPLAQRGWRRDGRGSRVVPESHRTTDHGARIMRKLSVLMATAFIDMLGFAMIFPLLPFYALRLDAAEWVIGWMIASFSIVQLASAPAWGRISDNLGRRAVIISGLGASAVAFLVFGFATGIWMLFLSRMVQGFGGGTTAVLQA